VQAGHTLAGLARHCPFIQPAGPGWYRYQPLFADVLALKLRREAPDQTAALHRQAAGWHQRHGMVAEAAGQAARTGDWLLAARIVVDELAIGELLRPAGSAVATALRPMRGPGTLPGAPVSPPGLLAAAARALGERRDEAASGWLAAAEDSLDRPPAGRELPARLAAALLRLAAARRSGDLSGAKAGGPGRRPCSGSSPRRCGGATRSPRPS
jgi:LuxR family transcriptional regulator, maltose regulon positive regulatory protein